MDLVLLVRMSLEARRAKYEIRTGSSSNFEELHPATQNSSVDLVLDKLLQLLAVDNAVYDTLGFVLEPEARRETVTQVDQ